MGRSWDVFCKVVDNYGDAAVCWRLARQLAVEHEGRVRLWIDDPATLATLRPELDPARAEQILEGVVVRQLADAEGEMPAEIVIDGFGGGLPEAYAWAMARRCPRPLWIVLEYLSAESWVREHHGLPSPHPALGIDRWFYFPGFGPGTGGLLREDDYDRRRASFDASRFWASLGMPMPSSDAAVVSLFGYENPALPALMEAWADSLERVVLAVPEGRLSAAVATWARARGGGGYRASALEIRPLPFLSQDRYDELLWACDWNFVRGEDSFVRAQLAGRPLVWQPYSQTEDAHRVKREAFFERYAGGLDPAPRAALDRLWRLWNGMAAAEAPAVRAVWSDCRAAGPTLAAHARRWSARLASHADLTTALARFCEEKLK